MATSVFTFAVGPEHVVGIFHSLSPLPISCSLCSQPTLGCRFLSDCHTWAFTPGVSVFLMVLPYGVVSDFPYLLPVDMAKPGGIPGSRSAPPLPHSVAAILFTLGNQGSLSQPVP